MSNRRQFVLTGAAGAAVTAFASTVAMAASGVPRHLGGLPQQQVFEGLCGASFDVEASNCRLTLEAVLAVEPEQRLEQFSLMLRGDEAQALDAGLYELRNTRTGRLALHLVPAGQDDAGQLYRADICLLV